MAAITDLRCWVVSDGTPGMENQAVGLAEAIGFAPEIKRVRCRFPWSVLPPALWIAPLSALREDGDALAPPWPDVLIATGRPSVAPALAIKRRSKGRTFAIQIQNPGLCRRYFDVVVTPLHDRVTGANVIATRGALHGITKERLAAAAKRFAPKLAHLKRPLVAVLVGGDNKVFRLTPALTRRLCDRLKALADRYGAGLAVTPSRRTGAANEAVLRETLGPMGAEIWDGSGENPYLGYLALADAVVATGDSVNMVCEACATGKPVYVFDLEGGSAKFRRFHDFLRGEGVTRPFDGTLANWSYAPLDDTQQVAGEIRAKLAAWRAGR
jgi:mitochondrial fission protein ELM1